jgi:site-specific DNA recombinase
MKYRPYRHVDSHIMCVNKCGNKSSKFKYVEEKLLQGLRDWLEKYESEYYGESQESSTLLSTYRERIEGVSWSEKQVA